MSRVTPENMSQADGGQADGGQADGPRRGHARGEGGGGIYRAFRPDDEADRAHLLRIWHEVGWLDDDNEDALALFMHIGRTTFAEHDGQPECAVTTGPGSMRYLDAELPFALVYGVATSRVVRKRGLAGRLTARCVARDAADGALVAGLGMFEQGYYNRLGFGTGAYQHILEFDPANLVIPKGLKTRSPKRLTPDDAAAMHANRLARRRVHGSCNFDDEKTTHAETLWGKGNFGLGFFDGPGGGLSGGPGGTLSHHMWCTTGGRDEHGPYRVRWLAWQTREQLLELLMLLRNLGDQVRLVRLEEPPRVQLQDLLKQPIKSRLITRRSEFEQRQWMFAWWQMRINDLPVCLEQTRLPWGDLRFNLVLSDPIEDRLPDDALQQFGWRGVAGEYVVSLGTASGAELGRDEALPTLHASVNAFTRMWLGVRPATALAITDDLRGPESLLEALDEVLRLPTPQPDWDF